MHQTLQCMAGEGSGEAPPPGLLLLFRNSKQPEKATVCATCCSFVSSCFVLVLCVHANTVHVFLVYQRVLAVTCISAGPPSKP